MRLNQRRQLLHHVVMHPIVFGPWFLGSVEIKPRTQTEIPSTIRITRHTGTTRAGIGSDDDQPQLGGQAHGTRFLHEILIGTGQARQPIQHRQLATLLGLRRQVHGKYHVATQHFGMMPIALMPATEALLTRNIFQTHGRTSGFKLQAPAAKRHSLLPLETYNLSLLL